MRIHTVETPSQSREFLLLPWKIYQDDPHWVAPLISERKRFFDPKRNPFFQHAEVRYFLAEKDGQVAGRIAAIVNHAHNQYHQDKVGFFGLFECVNDPAVARMLFDSARDFLREKGMEIMRGPANFSTNDDVGFLAEGFSRMPVLMMPYNPPYYLELAEKYGLSKAKDLYAFFLDGRAFPAERFGKIADRIKSKEGITIRKLEIKNLNREIQIIKEIYNSAWSKNWGFIPMTEAEIDFLADDLKKILDPNIAFIAFVNGKPAGFSLSLPDVNPVLQKLNGKLLPFGWAKYFWYTKVNNLVKGARVVTLGVVPEFQKKGIEVVFYVESIKNGLARGYDFAELSWVLEDNYLMTKPLEEMGGKVYKTYRMYEGRV